MPPTVYALVNDQTNKHPNIGYYVIYKQMTGTQTHVTQVNMTDTQTHRYIF